MHCSKNAAALKQRVTFTHSLAIATQNPHQLHLASHSFTHPGKDTHNLLGSKVTIVGKGIYWIGFIELLKEELVSKPL